MAKTNTRGVPVMARIFPETPPEDGVSAEIKVYRALEKLTDDYIVFYNLEWLCRGEAAALELPDFIEGPPPVKYPLGEIDFVVLDPQFGCFVIEVKGGLIKLEDGTWFSVDRQGEWHRIDNPILQARKNMYALIGKLREMPRFRNRYLYAGYGAILPDVASPHRDFGLGAPIELFGFAGDLDDPRLYLSRLRSQWLHLWQSRSSDPGKRYAATGLSSEDCGYIIRALAPSMELRRPTSAGDKHPGKPGAHCQADPGAVQAAAVPFPDQEGTDQRRCRHRQDHAGLSKGAPSGPPGLRHLVYLPQQAFG